MKTIPTTIVAGLVLAFASSAVARPAYQGGRGLSIQKPAQVQKSATFQFVPISLIQKITGVQSPQKQLSNKSSAVIRGGRGQR